MADIIHIGLGSNLGDREQILNHALVQLEAGGIAIRAVSRWLENPAEGMEPGAPPFLNGVVRAETEASPEAVLERCLYIEQATGRGDRDRRTPEGLYRPRSLDLDILLWGDRILNGPRLIVPHPRLHERDFVLLPLLEVSPEAVHPVLKQTIKQLWERRQAVR